VLHTLLELLLLECGSQQHDHTWSDAVVDEVLLAMAYAASDASNLERCVKAEKASAGAAATPLPAAAVEQEPPEEAAEQAAAEQCVPWSAGMLLLPLLHAAPGIMQVARQQMEREAQQVQDTTAAAAAAAGGSLAGYVLGEYGCLLQKLAETSGGTEGAAWDMLVTCVSQRMLITHGCATH
jgi:hypothetical protein